MVKIRPISRNARSRANLRSSTPDQASDTQKRSTLHNDTPWIELFRDFGYADSAIPKTPPPSQGDYGAILEWVTGGGWILEQDTNLAIAIWSGHVSPYHYERRSEAKVAGQDQKTQNVKPAEKKSSPRKRFKLSGSTGKRSNGPSL